MTKGRRGNKKGVRSKGPDISSNQQALSLRSKDLSVLQERPVGSIDRRLPVLGGCFVSTKGHFYLIEGRPGSIEGRFASIEGRLGSIGRRFVDRAGRFELNFPSSHCRNAVFVASRSGFCACTFAP